MRTPAKWQTGVDVFLIGLSITALIFSALSIQSIRDQKATIDRRTIFVIACDAAFLVVDSVIFTFDTNSFLKERKAQGAAKGQEVPLETMRSEGRGSRGEGLRATVVAVWRF
jgi:hypothetical protein